MRCLWLTREWPYPVDRGDLLYTSKLVENLAASGVSVTALALARADAAADRRLDGQMSGAVIWHQVPRRRINRAWSLLSVLPGDSYRTGTPEFRATLDRILAAQPWDVVVVDHIAMGWAVRPIERSRRRSGTSLPIVYVSHNHEMSLKPAVAKSQRVSWPYKQVLRYDARKFVHLENRLIHAAAAITAITSEDADLYRSDFPGTPVHCVLPGYDGVVLDERTIGDEIPRTCILFGSLRWIAKKQNLRDFLEVADEEFHRAAITLEIVGNVDDDFANEIRQKSKSTRVVGAVESVTPFMRGARLGIMLDRVGGGFKLKQLEYVFHRVPIATLDEQTHGLPLKASEDFLSASNYRDLTDRIIDTIDDLQKLNAMQQNAIGKIRDAFDWRRRGEEMRSILHSVVHADEPRAARVAGGEDEGTKVPSRLERLVSVL